MRYTDKTKWLRGYHRYNNEGTRRGRKYLLRYLLAIVKDRTLPEIYEPKRHYWTINKYEDDELWYMIECRAEGSREDLEKFLKKNKGIDD